MSYLNDPNEEHEVGITNAQENEPDPAIAELTKRMNAAFDAGRYAEAAAIAVSVTQRSVQELLETFLRHKVTVLRLDHEAFGIYAGQIEPTYDLQVDGALSEVVAAATEFGNRHAQQMILIARRLKPGETDPTSRLGLTIALASLQMRAKRFKLRKSREHAVFSARRSHRIGMVVSWFIIRRVWR